MKRRIAVVTSGHLSTCPRMLKAADILCTAGHDVRVIATCHEPWAVATDAVVRARRSWRLTTIDYRRGFSGLTYWRSGLRQRLAHAVARAAGPQRSPDFVLAAACGRVHTELVRAIVAEPVDFVYGGTRGALAAIAAAADSLGVPYGIDLEDLHSGETQGGEGSADDALIARIEERVLQRAAFATVSSEAIGDVYRERTRARLATIHNTFQLPDVTPQFARRDPARLRVYWFSQTIGNDRGLEEAIQALGRSGVPSHLTVRGRPQPGYVDRLATLAALQPIPVAFEHQPPADPDAMTELARDYDIGLAVEMPVTENRRVCASNKAFTYMLAGLAVIFADLPGTRDIAHTLGDGAATVPAGNIDALTQIFAAWGTQPARLESAKRAAWRAAASRWHFNHELEGGRLPLLVQDVLA